MQASEQQVPSSTCEEKKKKRYAGGVIEVQGAERPPMWGQMCGAAKREDDVTWSQIGLLLVNMLCLATLLEFGYSYYMHAGYRKGRPTSGSDPDTPLLVEDFGIFNADDFSQLQARSVAAAANLDYNPLSGGFQQTRGLVMHFTRHGMEHLDSHHLSWLTPFFDKVADDLCNAFVFNILVVPIGASVDKHLDVSLIQPVTLQSFTPHTVSVLYMKVPNETYGGELTVAGEAGVNQSFDNKTVAPREGLLVRFRGDARHAVHRICTVGKSCTQIDGADQESRISLVLEQYRLPAGVVHRSPDFILQPRYLEKQFLTGLSGIFAVGPVLCDLYLAVRRYFVKVPIAAGSESSKREL